MQHNYRKTVTPEVLVSEATFDTEECLLGALMIQASGGDRTEITEVSAILGPTDFINAYPNVNPHDWPRHARIFYAMLQSQDPPNELVVAHSMVDLGILQELDIAYFSHCIASCPCSLDYLIYARAVKDYSIKRQVRYHADRGNLDKVRELTDFQVAQQLRTSGRL